VGLREERGRGRGGGRDGVTGAGEARAGPLLGSGDVRRPRWGGGGGRGSGHRGPGLAVEEPAG